MRVKMPLGMSFAVGGTLVKSHGVGKRSCEQIVVARRDAMQDVRQRIASGLRKLLKRACVLFADEHRLEGPDRPERHDRGELVIFADDAVLLFLFDLQIFAQQTSSMLPLVRRERRLFLGRVVRQRGARPDLSVRVLIGTRRTTPVLWQVRSAAWRLPRFERAGADCERPSSRFSFQKSGRN